jgi:cytochrome c oxidase subunit 4
MHAGENAPSAKTIFIVYFSLLAIFALAVGAGFLPASRWKLPLGLFIAAVKMLLIFLFFMRLRYQKGIIRVFAFAAFFWLAIILTLTFADYLTRDWLI